MDIVKLFYPREKIAGIAISGSSLRLLLLERSDAAARVSVQAGVRLNPGILEKGEIKDQERFVAALKQLKEKAGFRLNRVSHAVVSLPPEIIYSQYFQFPNLTSEQIKEAMELNIATALPVSVSDEYLDWQEQTEFTIDSLKYKEVMLEAVKKGAADAYIDALQKADFVPLAFESGPASLARLIDNFKQSPGVAAYLNEEGVHFMVVEGNFVRFNHFVGWFSHATEDGTRELSEEFMIEFLVKQLKLVNSYYQAEHQGVRLKKLVLLAPGAIKAGLFTQLSGRVDLECENLQWKAGLLAELSLVLPAKGAAFDDSWLIAFGAALRGFIPRAEDTENSLMPVGTEAIFAKRKLISYVTLWSDIVTALALALMILFLGSYFFLGFIMGGVDEQLQARGIISAPLTLGNLEQKAVEINEKVAAMIPAAERANAFSHVFDKILALVPPGINVTHLSVNSDARSVNLSGIASSRDAALLLKNKLEQSTDFSDVNLPLGSLVQTQRILFTISFKIKQ